MTRPRSPYEPWALPGPASVYAVGDIHGRADLALKMIERLEAAAGAADTRPIAIFLGDYIDRGPNSREVLELLASGRPNGCVNHFLLGNHEQAMLAFLENPWRARGWLQHGGVQTLASYDIAAPSLGAKHTAFYDARDELDGKLPAAHKKFLNDLRDHIIVGDYLFVHAGIDPKRPLSKQKLQDLLWARERFINSSEPFAYCVVHGHTPVATPYIDARRICVDTGAYATGVLSAVKLNGITAVFERVAAAGAKRD